MITFGEYMAQLERVKKAAERLQDLLRDSYVKLYFCGPWWELKIYAVDDLNNEKYRMDFDTVEDLLRDLERMTIGARLALGMEV